MGFKHPAVPPTPIESLQSLGVLPTSQHGPGRLGRLRLLRWMLWPLCPPLWILQEGPACAADAVTASPIFVRNLEQAFSRLGFPCIPCPPASKQSLPALAFCLIEKSSLTASKASHVECIIQHDGLCISRTPNNRTITSLCPVD
jgi:hypothetical protein